MGESVGVPDLHQQRTPEPLRLVGEPRTSVLVEFQFPSSDNNNTKKRVGEWRQDAKKILRFPVVFNKYVFFYCFPAPRTRILTPFFGVAYPRIMSFEPSVTPGLCLFFDLIYLGLCLFFCPIPHFFLDRIFVTC